MSSEFTLFHETESSARILLGNEEKAKLEKLERASYKLSSGNQNWLLNKKVDGEIRPFSIVCYENGGKVNSKRTEVLKIKDHLFLYRDYFYMLGGIPVSRPPSQYLAGSKFICRLTNFPYSNHDHIDLETKNRLKRHRGEVVGEIFGLGSKGFHVKLEKELSGIELPLTASAYLIYSSI